MTITTEKCKRVQFWVSVIQLSCSLLKRLSPVVIFKIFVSCLPSFEIPFEKCKGG